MANQSPVGAYSTSLGGMSGIMDLIKFKMIAGTTESSQNSLFGVLSSIITLVIIEYLTRNSNIFVDFVNTLFNALKTKVKYVICNKIFRQTLPIPKFTPQSFKFKIRIEDDLTRNCLMKYYVQHWNLNYKYFLTLKDPKAMTFMTEYGFHVKTTNVDYDTVYNSLFTMGTNACIPVEQVGLDPDNWIYFYLNDSDAHHYIASNMSNQVLVDFLVKIRQTKLLQSTRPLFVSTSGSDVETPLLTNKTFDTLFFEQKQQLMPLLKTFIDNPQYYTARGTPQHLTFLLTGHPGCGKTSFIKALAKFMNYNIHNFKITPKTTATKFQYALEKKNTIIVFEDFDRIETIIKIMSSAPQASNFLKDEKQLLTSPCSSQEIELREVWNRYLSEKDATIQCQLLKEYREHLLRFDQQKENVLDMQTLLNAMDGINENPGRVMIFTCNHVERLDPAFLRPGRIDYTLEFKKCNRVVLAEILSNFYQCPVSSDEVSLVKEYSVSPAQVVALCKLHPSVTSAVDAIRKL